MDEDEHEESEVVKATSKLLDYGLQDQLTKQLDIALAQSAACLEPAASSPAQLHTGGLSLVPHAGSASSPLFWLWQGDSWSCTAQALCIICFSSFPCIPVAVPRPLRRASCPDQPLYLKSGQQFSVDHCDCVG